VISSFKSNHDSLELEILFDHNISNNIIPDNLLKLIDPQSIQISKIKQDNWLEKVSASLGNIQTKYFHIIRNNKEHKDGLIPIIINDSNAFGMGDHATTSLCIEAIEYAHDKIFHSSVNNVLDIGTGTGILAICAKKIWPKANIYGVDIDQVAIKTSIKHAKLNNVKIDFGMDLSLYKKRHYDIIVANILARPIIEMADDIVSLLSPNGIVILSGFLDDQSILIENRFDQDSLRCVYSLNKNNWVGLILS
jgi:ribosomal protein L11 methyltransferase